ncbi:MAG: PKD domain-containing protein [Methanobacteriota archaeon]|nr:MAG: PKD domain-containing protein [Euryarchaeota archaeon]
MGRHANVGLNELGHLCLHFDGRPHVVREHEGERRIPRFNSTHTERRNRFGRRCLRGLAPAALTVWDYSGNSATSTMSVTVRDTKAPVALGGGDRSVDETQSLFFDASASTDNVGVVAYSWDFGDGSSASTATANHAYAHAGVYHATLTVTDAAGNSATSDFQVTVRSNPILGLIEILAGIVAVLTIAVILLGWMVWGRRKREEKQTGRLSSERQLQPPPPPRDSDPLDMSFPPAPPKEP